MGYREAVYRSWIHQGDREILVSVPEQGRLHQMEGNTMRERKNTKANVPTLRTLAYIRALIAYKRTHIRRENERLKELEMMESELLSVVK